MIEFSKSKIRFYKRLLRYKNLKDRSGVFIAKKSRISIGTVFGDGTRVNGVINIKGKGKVIFGKYCAVGEDVRIISSNHDFACVNLQYALQKKIGLDVKTKSKDINIGHNVWIGDSVIILPGVTIGNGAVLAAGCVITRDVPSYSIVAGVPAKTIKKRFDEDKIKKIETSKWWDWSIEEMKRNSHFFKG